MGPVRVSWEDDVRRDMRVLPMPSSHPNQIEPVVLLALSSRPKSVLDIGVGFGKYGFLAREYLELWDGRNTYNNWRARVDGIEIHEDYIGPLQRMIYDDIFIGNALDVLPTVDRIYDVILLVDVLEHFSQEDAERLLVECNRKSHAIVISTPKTFSQQDAVFDNEFERHLSVWREDQFKLEQRKLVDHPTHLIMRFDSPPSEASLLQT